MVEALLSIAPLNWPGLGAAVLAGGLIGGERQMQGRPVGIRTGILICVGAYVFVAASISLHAEALDPSRVIGQVVTGIGFLGGGVMLSRKGVVYGITSAAAVWIMAAIGVIIGVGHPDTGVKLALLAIMILAGLDVVDKKVPLFQRDSNGVGGFSQSSASGNKKASKEFDE